MAARLDPILEATAGKYRRNLYLALEDLDFTWDEDDLKKVQAMWKAGTSVWGMAVEIGRDPDEVLILLIDLGRSGRIQSRAGGLLGIGGKESGQSLHGPAY